MRPVYSHRDNLHSLHNRHETGLDPSVSIVRHTGMPRIGIAISVFE